MNRTPVLLYTAMAFGYAFLYLPILSVVVYSFNASRMVTVWGGFSTKWYGALFENRQILEAAARSLGIDWPDGAHPGAVLADLDTSTPRHAAFEFRARRAGRA